MDLIGQLSGALGVPESQAQAVAGGLLSMVKQRTAAEAGGGAAAALDAAIPELGSWQAAAATEAAAPAASDALGGLLGGAAASGLLGAVGGAKAQEAAVVAQLLGKLGLDPSAAATVAPIVWSFLKERLPPDVLGMVGKAAPFLGAGGGGGAAGVLGGLFGR